MIWKLLTMISLALLAIVYAGCGTTKSQRATEQLLISDAVDRSVASIDFRPLAGRKVYLDTTYVKNPTTYLKYDTIVNADYVVSAVRQQMVTAGCLLEDNREAAEYVAEMRVGGLGTDAHDVVFGIPANNSLSSAASLVPSAPALPAIPEISVARKNSQEAAAKIALFAYHRETHRPVWQSGVAQAHSRAKDTWILGAGPFQTGTIHDGTKFMDGELPLKLLTDGHDDVTGRADPLAAYSREATYLPPPWDADDKQPVKQASFQGTPPPAAAPAPAPAAPAPASPPAASTPAAAAATPPAAPPAPASK
jgi:hypothetical protein